MEPLVQASYVPLPLNVQISATILHAESSSRLFVCPSVNFPELRRFQDGLQLLAKSVSSREEIAVGQVILFQSVKDQLWYRGTILQINGESSEILSLDFGFTENVSIDKLSPITVPSIKATKYWASRCMVVGCEDYQGADLAGSLGDLVTGCSSCIKFCSYKLIAEKG